MEKARCKVSTQRIGHTATTRLRPGAATGSVAESGVTARRTAAVPTDNRAAARGRPRGWMRLNERTHAACSPCRTWSRLSGSHSGTHTTSLPSSNDVDCTAPHCVRPNEACARKYLKNSVVVLPRFDQTHKNRALTALRNSAAPRTLPLLDFAVLERCATIVYRTLSGLVQCLAARLYPCTVLLPHVSARQCSVR